MPIRKPHIGKATITKRHVEEDLKFTSLDHIFLARGAGATITGNAGTTYATLVASWVYVDPSRYQRLRKATALFDWDPATTDGGLRIYNVTDAAELVKSEPGAAGWRIDEIDITDAWKTLTGRKGFRVETKGDGTTAPSITCIIICVESGNV